MVDCSHFVATFAYKHSLLLVAIERFAWYVLLPLFELVS
jgi:hypothetical protein